MSATVADALRDELRSKLATTPDKVQKFLPADDVVWKAFDPDAHTVDVVISTPSIDRDREIIEPRAFRGAKGKLLPLVDSHQIGDGIARQLGSATITKITDAEVVARLEYFVGKGNPDADYAWHLVEKRIAAFSHSFIPKPGKFTDANLDDEKVIREIADGKREIRRYHEIESLEVSHVIVGSNRDALLRSVAKGLYTEQQAQQIIEIAEQEPVLVPEEKAAPEPVEEKAAADPVLPDVIEIVDGTDEPSEVVEKAPLPDPEPIPAPSPVPVQAVSIKRIREEGTDDPETIEIRSGEVLVFAGTAEALVLALHAAKGEPNVKVTVVHEHKVAATVPAEDRAAMVSALTSGLKEVTTQLQHTVAKLPSIPPHVAEYPKLRDLLRTLSEVITTESQKIAARAAALEVAKVTGNVDAHLNGR